MLNPDLDAIRNRLEAFFEELEREYYLEGAGLKEEIRAAEIYDRYRDLSSIELVAHLRGISAGRADSKQLRSLVESTVQSYLGNRTRHLSDELLTAEASGTIALDDPREVLTFRASAVAMMNEAERTRRRAISTQRDRFVESTLNPLFDRIADETWAGVRELEYVSYRSMVEQLSGMPLGRLLTTTQGFLAATEEMYSDALTWYARRKLGLSIAELEKHDLGFIARASDYDRLFPAPTMVSGILGFVGRMGLDPTAGGRIRLDIEPRPKKSPRAFCSAVRGPEEVYLVIHPSGGIDDYKAFLHELGHALHFSHTGSDIAWEDRRLGDNSVTDTYAMLFDHFLHDPVWLRKVLGIQDSADLLRHTSFIELMMLRRYSAKLAYELELHASPSREGRPELYADLLTKATKVRYTTSHYLSDVDPFFYCARYLRAWMLQALARDALRERFDEDWFLNPRAGQYLKQIWGKGQGPSAEDLALEFGEDGLTMDRLRNHLEQVLGS